MRTRQFLFVFAVVAAALAAAAGASVLGPAARTAVAAPVDPRAGGLVVAMGEWTLVAEASAIRPGKVTFVVTNLGKFGHGFRIRSGSRPEDRKTQGRQGGRKDRFEARTRVLAPGESARLTVDLPAGAYDIECFVEDLHGDHEARGMRAVLQVRANAPFVTPKPKPTPARPVVEIEAFKYSPSPFTVKRGATVKWINRDAAKHTVSALNGSFTSKELTKGQAYARRFVRAGTVTYLCAVHPTMKAKLIVR